MTKNPQVDYESFITANTVVTRPPLVPETQLYLATEITPLWQATETTLAEEGLPPPFWAFAWAGGQAIARYLLDTPDMVAGRRVLDFAAGGGLIAIAAAMAGARLVRAVEIDPLAVACVSLNASLNGVAVDAVFDDVVGRDLDDVDVILAGDVCYEQPMAGTVIAWLREQAGQGRRVLLGDPGRAYVPTTGIAKCAHYDVPTTVELEDRTTRQTTVWRLMPG